VDRTDPWRWPMFPGTDTGGRPTFAYGMS